MGYTDNDLAMERELERAERNRTRCRCRGDMPGHCPGPTHCPMCDEADDEKAEKQSDFEDAYRCGEVR